MQVNDYKFAAVFLASLSVFTVLSASVREGASLADQLSPPPQPTAQDQPLQGQPPQGSQAPPVINPQAQAQQGQTAGVAHSRIKKGEVSFHFDDADVYLVIQTIFEEILNVNYIIDPRVKGRVNFRSIAPIRKENILPLLETILRMNDIGIVEEGGLYRIVPINELPKSPAPIGIGRASDKISLDGKALLQVVPVHHIKSSELVGILTPFLSTGAAVVDVPKNNHIILVDTDANIKRLLQLVEIFDNDKQVAPKVFVYQVQNTKAKDIVAILQQIFTGASAKQGTAVKTTQISPTPHAQAPMPPLTAQSAASLAGGEVLVSEYTKIIADESTNSVIILALPDDYTKIEDAIAKIDVVPRQVLIETLIAEVTLKDDLKFGIEWSLNGRVKTLGIHPSGLNTGTGFNAGTLGNFGSDNTFVPPINVVDIANKAQTGGLTGFTFAAVDRMGFVRTLLNTLATEDKMKVLASPHIVALDNKEARIQIGSQVPIFTSVTAIPTTSGTSVAPTQTNTIQYKDTGTILKVKPMVNTGGLVTLEITQEVSTPRQETVAGVSQFVIDKREFVTNLVAQDGQTIVIGGLISEKSEHNRTGLPLISKIPILGYLFGRTEDTKEKTELIVLLTPHVIRNQKEAQDLTSEFINKKSKDLDVKVPTGVKTPSREKPSTVTPDTKQ